jgi:tetratricopeptide (TPR) repeat protein
MTHPEHGALPIADQLQGKARFALRARKGPFAGILHSGGRVAILLWILTLLILPGVAARSPVTPDPVRMPDDASAAVANHLYNMEYDAASQQLTDWLKRHPTDLRSLNQLASVLLHRQMYQRQIMAIELYGESGEVISSAKSPASSAFQSQLFAILGKAQKLAEERLKRDPKDEDALYWAGCFHATRAAYDFSVLKSYVSAVRESMRAREYHTRLLAVNPKCIDAWLVIGVNDYVAGSLPWYIKAAASLSGFRGNRSRGLEEVKRVTQEGRYAREDAKFILALLYRREKMYAERLALLENLANSYPRNVLLRREIASLRQNAEYRQVPSPPHSDLQVSAVPNRAPARCADRTYPEPVAGLGGRTVNG